MVFEAEKMNFLQLPMPCSGTKGEGLSAFRDEKLALSVFIRVHLWQKLFFEKQIFVFRGKRGF